MKFAIWSLLLALAAAPSIPAQNVVLYDDFEDGAGMWQTNSWGLTTDYSFSPTHSFTESPAGLYPEDTVLTATTITGANLLPYLGARLELQTRWEIEQGFDFCWIEASRDGSFWVPLGSLTGENSAWQLKQYDLGAFAGLPNVRIRFRFVSDPLYTYDGTNIDNVTVLGLPTDESGPLIIHRGPEGYRGDPGPFSVSAQIWDVSGLSQEHLYYRLDGGLFQEAPQDSIEGEYYYHTIPAQEAGTLVEYYFQAADATPQMHVSVSDTFAYLAGQMLILDDGVSENVMSALPGTRCAVRFQAQDAGYVTSALVRIYTDPLHPLDSVNVYVWADSSGLPGPVLAGPIEVWPASTPEDPEAWTWVDLRPYALTAPDTFHVGVELGATGLNPSGALSYDAPPRFLRSSENDGPFWQSVTFGDFHIRCVVGDFTPTGMPNPPQPALPAPWAAVYPNPTNGAIRLQLQGLSFSGEMSLAMYDLQGRVVSCWQERITPGQISLSVPLKPGLASGVYLLDVGFGEGSRHVRLKVIHLP